MEIFDKKPLTRPCVHCAVPFTEKVRTVRKYCLECAPTPADQQRLLNFDLAAPEFAAMYFEQDGECAICHVREAKQVDHDHATGKVRGLLCYRCNVGLGYFMDSVQNLANAIVYLEDHNG